MFSVPFDFLSTPGSFHVLLTTSCVTHCTGSGESVSPTSKLANYSPNFVSNCAVSSMEMSNDIPSAFNRVVSRSSSLLTKKKNSVENHQETEDPCVVCSYNSLQHISLDLISDFPFLGPATLECRYKIHTTPSSPAGEKHIYPKQKCSRR